MSIHRPLTIAALPTIFDGASDALEAALRFECSREDLHAYEVRDRGEGFAVEVFSVDPRESVGFLAEPGLFIIEHSDEPEPGDTITGAGLRFYESREAALPMCGQLLGRTRFIYRVQSLDAGSCRVLENVTGAPEATPPNPLRDALQWLLDDLHDAGETHGEDGTIFDSVAASAAALVTAGGVLNWFTPEDAAAFRAKAEATPALDFAHRVGLPPRG